MNAPKQAVITGMGTLAEEQAALMAAKRGDSTEMSERIGARRPL
jgi:hypothetical protein